MRLIRQTLFDYIGICDNKTGWWSDSLPGLDEAYREVKLGKGWADLNFYLRQPKKILVSDSLFEWSFTDD